MTTKELFEEWAKQPIFTKLAGTYRQDFMCVFGKPFADRDVMTIDKKAVIAMLKLSDQPQAVNVRAVSALNQVLVYGATRGFCNKPDWDNSILSEAAAAPKDGIKAHIGEVLPPEAKPKPAKKKKAAKRPKKQSRHATSPRRVCQIDPKTLKVIQIFASAADGGRACGSNNVLRAIERGHLCGGFYWCFPEQADTFKPNEASIPDNGRSAKRGSTRKQRTKQPPREVIEAAEEELDAAIEEQERKMEALRAEREAKADWLKQLQLYDDVDLIDEMRRRGWEGNVTFKKNIEL